MSSVISYNMTTVTFQIELTTKINDDVDPGKVTFDIGLSKVAPQVDGVKVGTVTDVVITNVYIPS